MRWSQDPKTMSSLPFPVTSPTAGEEITPTAVPGAAPTGKTHSRLPVIEKASTSPTELCTHVEPEPTMIDGAPFFPRRNAIAGLDSTAARCPDGAAIADGQPGSSLPVAASMT